MNRPSATYAQTVTVDDTAAALDPSLPAAASTPFVLTLVESACLRWLEGQVLEGEVTVGAHVSLDHLKPTAVGAQLEARATLESNEGQRYTWTVEVFEGDELAARATHTRVCLPLAAIVARLRETPGPEA